MTKPTVYDVAKKAGVSIATVSFAFGRPERVKQETLVRVLEVASELGYVPSGSARGLAKGRTRAIGLYAFDYLIDSGDSDSEIGPNARHFPLYSDEVQRGIELECRRLGYALMIGSGSDVDNDRQIIDVAGRVDALITFTGVTTSSALDQVASRMPVVELGGSVDRHWRQTVAVNNYDAMRELTNHLISRHGFRHITYVGQPSTHELAQRLRGFQDSMTAAGLPLTEPLDSGPLYDRVISASVNARLAHGPHPDAFVCATDQEALVVLDILAEREIRVPEDIAVTGFDGILAGQIINPRLTTARQPMEQIGRAAVRKSIKALDPADPSPVIEEPLVAIPIIGGTCGC